MNDISSTFCILPFTHLATLTDGSVLLCCVAQNDLKLNLNDVTLEEAWNSEAVRRARLKMLKGEKVSSCSHCYREEAGGYKSHRVTENRTWVERFTRDWLNERVQSVTPTGHLPAGMVAIDLRLGNTCNLSCVMCQPQDSSKWASIAKKLTGTIENRELRESWEWRTRIDATRFEWYKRPEFWDDIRSLLPTMREIVIGGGEPMLLEEHQRLIEECVSSGHAPHIQIRYHTNGTILDPAIFELWKHFKLVEVFISMDGIGDRNTYMRHPASWEKLESNLRTFDSYPHGNMYVSLLCSVHLMSAFYLDEFAQWVEDQKFKLISRRSNGYFHPGVVHYPPYLSTNVLPPEIKRVIDDKVRAFESKSKRPSSKIGGVLGVMNQTDRSDLLPQTREYIRKLDAARGTNFAKALPELNELLQVY